MTFQVQVKCLICRKLADAGTNSEKETNTEALNLLHSKLCLALKLEFSPEFWEWDFAEEPFPYCEACGQRLQRLAELIDQLNSIEEEISGSLATVSALVITSDKGDTNPSESDPLITPELLGQSTEYSRGPRLQEKHSYFRSLITRRYDARVIVERCNVCLNDSGLSHEQSDVGILPKHELFKTEPGYEGFPGTAPEEDSILSESEYKVDSSTIDDKSFVDPETILGLKETWTPWTEAPASSVALNPVETPATSTFTSAKEPGDSVKSIPSKRPEFKVTFDEASQTYEMKGFKFKESEKGYECSTCGHISGVSRGQNAKERNIKQHIKTVHLGIISSTYRLDPRVCDECGKVCSSKSQLYIHRVRAHLPPKFQCGRCGAKFTMNRDLKIHVLTHNEQRERPASCEQCDKRFFTQKHLRRHYSAVHARERHEQCPRCALKFKSQDALQNHIRWVHDRERRGFVTEALGIKVDLDGCE